MGELADLDFIDALAGGLPRMQRIARLLTADADAAEDALEEF